jgi:hypothetical protein
MAKLRHYLTVLAMTAASGFCGSGRGGARIGRTTAPQHPRSVRADRGFTSPLGNIGCYIDITYARCDIRDRTWSPPPRSASCPDYTDWGQGVQLHVGSPAGFVCAGDTALMSGDPLPYGDKIVAGSIECTSTPDGISCWDFVYGGEFAISRDSYRAT